MFKYTLRYIFMVSLAPILMAFCPLQQGVKGKVLLQKDAMMPLKGKSTQVGKPFATFVYVYPATSVDQLVGSKGNYAKGIKAKLIKKAQSNAEGNYKIRLRPGKYTLVLGYNEGIYIPFFSGSTGVAIFEVAKHQYQEIDLTISNSSIF